MPKSIAVIGAGHMGGLWIKKLKDAGHKVPIIVDPESSEATHKARPAEMKVDGIIIASPNDWHAMHAVTSMEYGLPMLIEKPLAGSADAADLIVRNARLYKVPVMVGHIERFNPAYIELKKVVSYTGFLAGILQSLRTGPDRLGVPPELDLGIHDYDLANDLFGWPLDVNSIGVLHPSGVSIHNAIYSSNKMRRLRLYRGDVVYTADLIKQTLFGGTMPFVILNKIDPLEAEMNAFLKMIDTGVSPISVDDGFQAVLTAENIIEQKSRPTPSGLGIIR